MDKSEYDEEDISDVQKQKLHPNHPLCDTQKDSDVCFTEYTFSSRGLI